MNDFQNFTVFDFETTGLDPGQDQVIEACVVRVRNGAPVLTFNTLVALNPGAVLTPKITELTGHSEADLLNAPTEEELMYMLSNMIPDDELLVAHNALFDLSYLAHGYHKYGFIQDVRALPNPFIDTVSIARSREPFPHKLIDVCKRNNIVLDEAHSALGDTLALVDVVTLYNQRENLTPWINIAGYRVKYGEPLWTPYHATIIKQGSEIIEHSSKPVKRRPNPNVVYTRNKRKKQVPDDPKVFEKECMPSAFIDKELMTRIDGFIDQVAKAKSGLLQLSAPPFFTCTGHTSEFDNVWNYVTNVKKIPEENLSSSLDTPEDYILEIFFPEVPYTPADEDPFANYSRIDDDPFAPHNMQGGRIIISEDDLPF